MKHAFTFFLSSKHTSENALPQYSNLKNHASPQNYETQQQERKIGNEISFSWKGRYLFLDKAGVPQGEGREVSFVRQGGICSARLQTKQTGVGQRG